MARPNSLDENFVVSLRIEKDMYQILHDLAALQTINSGRKVSVQELIRSAIEYTYKDNEHLRESFRRTRAHITKRFK